MSVDLAKQAIEFLINVTRSRMLIASSSSIGENPSSTVMLLNSPSSDAMEILVPISMLTIVVVARCLESCNVAVRSFVRCNNLLLCNQS